MGYRLVTLSFFTLPTGWRHTIRSPITPRSIAKTSQRTNPKTATARAAIHISGGKQLVAALDVFFFGGRKRCYPGSIESRERVSATYSSSAMSIDSKITATRKKMSTKTDRIRRGILKQHPNSPNSFTNINISRMIKDATMPKLPAVIPRAAVVSFFPKG